MNPVDPVRKNFIGLLYKTPMHERTRLKDIIGIIIWARENNVRVRRLRKEQISEALAQPIKDESRKPRLKVYSVVDDYDGHP